MQIPYIYYEKYSEMQIEWLKISTWNFFYRVLQVN